jgi:hypothetical protein
MIATRLYWPRASTRALDRSSHTHGDAVGA